MSTKIYDAYRIRDGVDLWPFLRSLRNRAEQEVAKALEAFQFRVARAMEPEHPDLKWRLESPGYKPEGARLAAAEDHIFREYRKQASSTMRDIFDLSVSIVLREYQGRFYLKSYCDMMMGHALDFMRDMPELEDFHYQNQSDRPEGIDDDAWEARGAIWDQIHDVQGWQHSLVMEVMSPDQASQYMLYQPKTIKAQIERYKTWLASEPQEVEEPTQ